MGIYERTINLSSSLFFAAENFQLFLSSDFTWKVLCDEHGKLTSNLSIFCRKLMGNYWLTIAWDRLGINSINAMLWKLRSEDVSALVESFAFISRRFLIRVTWRVLIKFMMENVCQRRDLRGESQTRILVKHNQFYVHENLTHNIFTYLR